MPEYTSAVKFTEDENGDWFLEGYGLPYYGPMAGKDLTGTYFTPDTDFCLQWWPEGAQRPVLYGHAKDPTIKNDVVGRVADFHFDEVGGWTKAQIDKAHKYAEGIKKLADAGLLSFSSGAIDHNTVIAEKSGEIRQWPWMELSLVVNPANPDPLVAARYSVKAAEVIEHLAAIGVEAPEQLVAVKAAEEDDDTTFAGPHKSFPIRTPKDVHDAAMLVGHAADPTQVKANIIRIAHAKGPTFAAQLPKTWTDDGDGDEASGKAADLEPVTTLAIKEGRRNSGSDQARIQAIHDAAMELGADCGTGTGKSADLPPADVLATKAGDDAEPQIAVLDLDALRDRLELVAVKHAKGLLGLD